MIEACDRLGFASETNERLVRIYLVSEECASPRRSGVNAAGARDKLLPFRRARFPPKFRNGQDASVCSITSRFREERFRILRAIASPVSFELLRVQETVDACPLIQVGSSRRSCGQLMSDSRLRPRVIQEGTDWSVHRSYAPSAASAAHKMSDLVIYIGRVPRLCELLPRAGVTDNAGANCAVVFSATARLCLSRCPSTSAYEISACWPVRCLAQCVKEPKTSFPFTLLLKRRKRVIHHRRSPAEDQKAARGVQRIERASRD